MVCSAAVLNILEEEIERKGGVVPWDRRRDSGSCPVLRPAPAPQAVFNVPCSDCCLAPGPAALRPARRSSRHQPRPGRATCTVSCADRLR